jgi:hypothetical protein
MSQLPEPHSWVAKYTYFVKEREYKIQWPNTVLREAIHLLRSSGTKLHFNIRLVFHSLSRNTNKMQLCNRIYYSKVYWRLNMFRAAHRSSSGALNCICSLWFIYPCDDRPLSRLGGNNGWSPHGYTNQRLQIHFGAPDDVRYAARNMLSLQ